MNTSNPDAPYVTSVSIDSFSRKPGETPSDYTVVIPNQIQRVKSIRVGSAYIPNTGVTTISDTYNNCIGYAEPIQFDTAPTFVLQETVTDTNLSTGVSTVFLVNTVTIGLPPTLNRITAAANGANVAITTFQTHNINCGITGSAPSSNLTWPGLTFAGCNFPIVTTEIYSAYGTTMPTTSAPVITPTNASIASTTQFTLPQTYLDTFVPWDTALNATRLYNAPSAGFVYAPPMTLSQLLLFLNGVMQSLWQPTNLAPTGTSLMLNHFFSVDDLSTTNATIVLKSIPTTNVIGTTKRVTTSKLLYDSSINQYLGLNYISGSVQGYPLSSAVPDLALSDKLVFPVTGVPSMRVVKLKHGDSVITSLHDDPVDIAKNAMNAMSPLDFSNIPVAANRTLEIITSAGTSTSLVFPRAKFVSGNQLADFITSSGYGDFMGSFSTSSAGVGLITISSPSGNIFTINFASAPEVAVRLGFNPVAYSGSSTYTSTTPALYTGNPSNTTIAQSSYNIFGDTFKLRFTFATNSPPLCECSQTYVSPGAGYPATDTHTWVLGAAGNLPYPAHFGSNDVVQVSYPVAIPDPLLGPDINTVAITTCVIQTEWQPPTVFPQPAAPPAWWWWPRITLFDSPSFVDPPVQFSCPVPVSPGAVVSITPIQAVQFQLLFNPQFSASTLFGFPKRLLPASPMLAQTQQPLMNNIDYLNGLVQTSTNFGAAQLYVSPYQWEIQGPPYILLQLRPIPPVGPTGANVHIYGLNEYSIIAKFYIRALPYQHIAEELLEITFPTFVTVGSVSLVFLNPDGSLVDFNGRNNSLTLLFQSYMNTVSGRCP